MSFEDEQKGIFSLNNQDITTQFKMSLTILIINNVNLSYFVF